MDITDENEINITDDVNITDESSEAQDLTMAGRANVNGGKIAANTPPSSPPPSSTNNGVSLLLNSALTNAAANGGSEAYQNSMLGILINKFGINGLQVRHYYYHNFRIKITMFVLKNKVDKMVSEGTLEYTIYSSSKFYIYSYLVNWLKILGNIT